MAKRLNYSNGGRDGVIEKAVVVVELLLTMKFVTVNDLVRSLGISRRQAYRYLRSAESKLPIIRRDERLNGKGGMPIGYFELDRDYKKSMTERISRTSRSNQGLSA